MQKATLAAPTPEVTAGPVGHWRRWLIEAPAGTVGVYHRGMLFWDADPDGGADAAAAHVRDYMRAAYSAGLVALVQQRVAPTVITENPFSLTWGAFEYQAIRTAVPWKEISI